MRRLSTRLGAGVLLVVVLFGGTRLAAAGQAGWANPSSVSLTLVGPASTAMGHPVAFPNLNCTLQPYPISDQAASGCLQMTDLGLYDLDHSTLFWGNTEHVLTLQPNHADQVILPWTNSTRLLALNPVSTGSFTAGYYRAAASAVSDVYDLAGQLIGKHFDNPPDGWLTDVNGQQAVINPGSVAFSDSGYWLVAETMTNNFVRINSATLQATDFGAVLDGANGTAHGQDLIAVSGDGRFVAVANNIWQSFRVYDLGQCVAGPLSKPGWLNCAWHDYWPAVSGLADFQRLVSVHFVNDGLLAVDVGLSDGISTYELSPDGPPASLTDYLGLGDSYTSGEGAYDYLPGTDTGGNMCHLSRGSYPLLLTRDLFTTPGGHSVACSGALIDDILPADAADYTGQATDLPPLGTAQLLANYLPGYLPQSAFVASAQPGIITVSIGGNDIGFGDMIRTCVEPHLTDTDCFQSYEDRLEVKKLVDRTVSRWINLFLSLQQLAPKAHLYAVGYPQIADPDGNCADNVRLSHDELEFMAELIDYLDASIASAAHSAGINYIDISQALVGHRLCEASSAAVAMNGLTAGRDSGVLGLKFIANESYHPNALGQALIEQAILHGTHNLGQSTGVVTAPNASQLLTAPVSGRTVYTLVPDDHLAKVVGHTLQLHGGSRDGLRPGDSYQVHMDGTLVARVTADLGGNITVEIPFMNSQRLDVTGENQAGEPVDVMQAIGETAGESVELAPAVVAVLQTGGASPGQVLGVETVSPIGMEHLLQPAAALPVRATLPVLIWWHGAIVAASLGGAGQAALIMCRRAQKGIIKSVRFLYNKSMLFLRLLRGFFRYLFVLILFSSLLALAAAGAIDHNLTKPATVESWLAQSGLYDHFLDNVTKGSQQSIGSNGGQFSGLSLSDAAVQQAAKTAFPPSFIQQSVNTVVDSNYAWLQGKTAAPSFSIDLTSAKQTFATEVGKYVTAYFNMLPVCSAAQLSQLPNLDPLHAPCRPGNIDATTEGNMVTQEIANSDSLLGSTVITAGNINPNDKNGKPYYQKLSELPHVYRAARRLPWALGGVALVSAIAVLLLTDTRRRGLRKLAWIFAVSGVVLVIYKLIAVSIEHHLAPLFFFVSDSGPLQVSGNNVIDIAVNAIARTELYFAAGYLLLALLIVLILVSSRHREKLPAFLAKAVPASPVEASSEPMGASNTEVSAPVTQPAKPTAPPVTSVKPASKRPPRLVQ